MFQQDFFKANSPKWISPGNRKVFEFSREKTFVSGMVWHRQLGLPRITLNSAH